MVDWTLQRKSKFCIPFLGIAGPQSQFPHSCVGERARSWKYTNLSQIYECKSWETEHYYSVLEITVSFLGIHKWEQDIYIGFSPALHLQWSIQRTRIAVDGAIAEMGWKGDESESGGPRRRKWTEMNIDRQWIWGNWWYEMERVRRAGEW